MTELQRAAQYESRILRHWLCAAVLASRHHSPVEERGKCQFQT